jgi:hypothetical protein
MKKPNFFIIGAPKCGTTSLASWLSEHPQVFMAKVKEPMYFNTDFGGQVINNLRDYENLFIEANDCHLAVGEASTFYLASNLAVENIIKYSDDAKLIVMLRNPVEMAISLHAQVCKGLEDEFDFDKVWGLQERRIKGYCLPKYIEHPELYLYGERCKVGTQLAKLFDKIDKSRVLVVFLEDLIANRDEVYKSVLAFLGLSEILPLSFEVKNQRRGFRSKWLKKFMYFVTYLKRILRIKISTGMFTFLNKINTKKNSEEVSEKTLKDLYDYFDSEVKLVESIVGRIPSTWKD